MTTLLTERTGDAMEFHDGHDGHNEGGEGAVERDGAAPRRRWTPGWTLVAAGLAGQLVVWGLQARRFAGPLDWYFWTSNIIVVAAGAAMTAGFLLLALRRWFLPELVARLRDVDDDDQATTTG